MTDTAKSPEVTAPEARTLRRAAPSARLPLRRYSRTLLILPFLPLLFLALAPTRYKSLRAASILLEIGGAPALACSDSNPVSEEEITFPSLASGNATSGNITTERARIYHPIGVAHPSPVVVVHGVHHLGMDE